MPKNLGLKWVPTARGYMSRRAIQIDWVYCRRNANMNQSPPLWLIYYLPNFKSLIPYISSLFGFLHVLSNHYRQLSTPSSPPSSPQNPSSVSVCQFIKHADTYYHDQKSNGHNNEQCESKPTQYHCRRTNSAADTTIAEVLSDGTGRHRSCVLP